MGFQKQFEEIQKDRMGVVNSSVYPGLKNLVSEIYPEEAHFIYELLQNAEDTLATKTIFKVYEDKLVFKHNGIKQFDAADINAITNIAHSTKKDNYIQAGKFRIGFKTVNAIINAEKTCLLGKDLPRVSFGMTGGISNFSYGRGLFTIYLKTDTAIKPTSGAMIESASI